MSKHHTTAATAATPPPGTLAPERAIAWLKPGPRVHSGLTLLCWSGADVDRDEAEAIIKGSKRIVQASPDSMAAALCHHLAVWRESVTGFDIPPHWLYFETSGPTPPPA